MTAIIEVQDLKRVFQTEEGLLKRKRNEVHALRGLSFNVNEGEVFGLLGPNGAGKTTTIKILTTLLTPSSGDVKILGLNPVSECKKLRPQINFILGGERNLYWRLSAYDNLAYFADLYHVPRIDQKRKIIELLDLVGLTHVANRRVETFSKGMKQRLQIARGLINNPKVLFLDEPTIGLDPVSAQQLRTIIKQLNHEGTTVLLTTHYMMEADELCNRIAFVNEGNIVALDSPENFKKVSDQVSVIECKIIGSTAQEIQTLKMLPNVLQVSIEQMALTYHIRIQTYSPQEVIPKMYQVLSTGMITDLSINQPTLEDVYIQIVGGKAS
ncbi:ABC transporter ATP-binding protein [Cytobacillus sp. IB215665]|uniref:ABC transporter ATP-binding protein n=1 Tax=Cytobacillus sp. IB215665 TaxID=3097357 RepID=UPI002A0F4517|nr:ATP-binding cassette domain-containing protein [Cytobacillus sp. IB215665]MDX8366747.1 ATP-binding cassette domain-containing protein [Cytobacillus sp. IB215665]